MKWILRALALFMLVATGSLVYSLTEYYLIFQKYRTDDLVPSLEEKDERRFVDTFYNLVLNQIQTEDGAYNTEPLFSGEIDSEDVSLRYFAHAFYYQKDKVMQYGMFLVLFDIDIQSTAKETLEITPILTFADKVSNESAIQIKTDDIHNAIFYMNAFEVKDDVLKFTGFETKDNKNVTFYSEILKSITFSYQENDETHTIFSLTLDKSAADFKFDEGKSAVYPYHDVLKRYQSIMIRNMVLYGIFFLTSMYLIFIHKYLKLYLKQKRAQKETLKR